MAKGPINERIARPSTIQMPDEQLGRFYPPSEQAAWVCWFYFLIALAGAGFIAWLVYQDLLVKAMAKFGGVK